MHYEIIRYEICETDEKDNVIKSKIRKPKKKPCKYPNKAAIERVKSLYFKLYGKLLWLSWRKITNK